MDRSVLLLGLAVAVVLSAGAASAATTDPRFEVYVPEPTLTPGTTSQLTVQLVNDAADPTNDTTRTAAGTNATLVANGTAISVESGTRFLGDLPDGALQTATFAVRVPDDAEAGTHTLYLELGYHADGENTTRTVEVPVRVEDRPRFVVASSSADAPVGDSGPVAITLTNTGTEDVTGAQVTVQSRSADVTFGTSATATRYVGDWPAGENRTVTVDASVADGAERVAHALTATVSYDDEDGTAGQSRGLAVGLTPAPEQSFGVGNATGSLIVGDRGTVEATVTNDGPHPVEDAVVTIATRGPTVTPVETEQVVGDLAPGESATFSLPVRIASGAEPGDRQFSFVLEYDNREGERRASDPLRTTVAVTPEQSFSVTDPESTLLVGDRGTVTATVRNEGPETARDAVVRLTTENPNVRPRETAFAVGDLPPGGSAEVSFPVAIADTAEAGARQLSFAVEYENGDGDARLVDGLRTRVDVAGEQTFAVDGVESTLRVGADGRLTATVRNEGPLPVGDAVVVLTGVTANADPTATEFAAGDLGVGDAVEVSFPVEMTESAEAGPRQFSLSVEYRNRQDDRRTSEPLSVRLDVAPERDQFDVEAEGASLAAGSSGTVTLVVTNNGEAPVTDVSAKLFADDPLSASDDEAFVDRLAPGESAELVFGVGAGGTALQKSYPLSVDFQYDEADGDTKLSDTYSVPVAVTESAGSEPPVPAVLGAVVLLAVVVGAAVWWRRR